MATLFRLPQALNPFTPVRKAAPKQRYPTPYPSLSPERRLDEDEPLSPFTKLADSSGRPTSREYEDLEGETLLEDPLRTTRKRGGKALQGGKRSAKRQKSDDGYRPGEGEDDSDFEGDTLLASTPPGRERHQSNKNSARQDRRAMPPPPRPRSRLSDIPYVPGREIVDRDLQNRIIRTHSTSQGSSLDEDEIFTQKTACRREDRSEINPQFEYDRAFRHAQAQELPEDSGLWSEVDKDLFRRLAMRGFEPLVPGHWAMDFKTLPQMLFAAKGQEALITPFGKREFRAKYFLRNLFNIASKVRDRSLVGLPTEPCIKRTLKQYISWALWDAGVHPEQRPKAMPVHTIVSKRPGERTQDTIRRMSRKLYGLAHRYQNMYCIQQSVETHPSDRKVNSSSVSTPEFDDAQMPTLIGLMIASSVVVVVTLDSRSSPPDSMTVDHHRHRRRDSFDSSSSLSSSSSRSSSQISEPSPPGSLTTTLSDAPGLRVIANFDFSTCDGYDVWDGLAMAICVMRIRKTMLDLAAVAEREGQTGRGGIWEKVRVVKMSETSEDG